MKSNEPSAGRRVIKYIVFSLLILVVLFFLIPAMMSTPRDGGIIPNEIHHLVYPGLQNDQEYLRVARLALENKGAPYNPNLQSALMRKASVHYLEIMVNDLLAPAKSFQDFYEISDILLIIDESIHRQAGLSTIDYPKDLALLLNRSQRPPREQTLKAWEDRVTALKKRFPRT